MRVHLHTCALGGVFVEREGGVEFVAAPPPSRAELYALVRPRLVRVTKWLQRHGHLRDEADVSNEAHALSFEDALVLAATGRGTMDVLRDDGEPSEPDAEAHDTRTAWTPVLALAVSLAPPWPDCLPREKLEARSREASRHDAHRMPL